MQTQQIKAFVQHGKAGESMRTEEVPHQFKEAPRSGQTASGYGKKLPTEHMVHFHGRWRRVYAICYSNCATHYITDRDNARLIVSMN